MNVERVKGRIKRYLRYMNGPYREDDEETKSYLERIEKSRRVCGGLGWQYVAEHKRGEDGEGKNVKKGERHDERR